MKRDYRVYLNDILLSLYNATHFVEGISNEEFINDRKIISAVV